MATLNKVMLIGRLTANPSEPRNLGQSGTQVISFRLAVGRSRKNPQTGQWENDPNPLYIDCEVFHSEKNKRNLLQVVQKYTKQGEQIFVEGRLQLDQWDDKNGGGKRSKHKVVVESIELLGGAKNGEGGSDGGRQQQQRGDDPPDDFDGGGEDPIPF